MRTDNNPLRKEAFLIPSLDGIRAIAVLTVFFGHGLSAPEFWPGHVGVTIFFFLSGYLITTLLRREYQSTGHISLIRFYLRRIFRILPPAYVAITLAVVLGATGVLVGAPTIGGILAELLSYTNYYIVVAGRGGLPPETTQFWSLGVEEHYYLVIPIAVLILLRRKLSMHGVGLILVGIAMLVPIWRVYLGLTGASFDRLYVSTDTRIDSLLFGSAFALLMNPALGDRLPGGERFAKAISKWIAPLAVVVFIGSALIPGQHFRLSIADVVQCVCLVPIFWFIIKNQHSFVGRMLNHPVMVRVGVLSFSIYLFHRIVLTAIANVVEVPFAVDVIALMVTVVLAQLVYWSVEKPSIRIRKRIERRILAREAESRLGRVSLID